MRTISREVVQELSQHPVLTPQRLHAELLATSVSGCWAYLHGALHDATVAHRHKTVRFGQSEPEWLDVLAALLTRLGRRSWRYREGRNRRFWVLETSALMLSERPPFVSSEEQCAYARGYFDAEGGVPRDGESRFYVQFVQKNRADLSELRQMLEAHGIACGTLHNPSAAVDPDLWRFYVLRRSHENFIERVGSWHPRKRRLLEARIASSTRMKR